MYVINEEYKNYINNSLSRKSKSKIIIDGVEYLDNVLMTTPKISHTNTTFIGGFPSKTVSFDIKDETGTLSLNNKWIEVYRGLDINGEIVWLLMGVFKNISVEDIKTNKTNKTISFKGYDKRQLLDVVYTTSLDWEMPHTGLEIVLEACSNCGLELENNDFNFANYTFNVKPNFASDITYAEVISRLAELGGEIALITRDGKVQIKGATKTDIQITKQKRKSLTKENKFGEITTLVLGNEGYDDDIIYPKARNLFNINENAVYSNGTSLEIIDNKIKVTSIIAGAYLSSGILIDKEKVLNKTVTLSANITTSGTNNAVAILYWLDANYEPTIYLVPINETANSYTYVINEVPTGAEHLAVLLYSNYTSETGNVGDYAEYENIQLEIGEVVNDYVPYLDNYVEWRIEDNPFVELIRQSIIQDVAPFIIGKSIIPFELNECIDDFYLDLNDIITIVNSDGTTFESTILSYETVNKIKSTIKAPAQTETHSNYEIAGGIKQSLNRVKLEVNHANNEIKGLVQKTDDLTTKTSEIIQNAEEFTTSFYQDVIKAQIDDLTGVVNNEIETRSSAVRVSMDDKGNATVHLGASSSAYTLEVKNDGLYIYQDGQLLQYLQGSFAKIPNLEVEETFKFGALAIRKSTNGKIRGVRGD